MPRIEGASEEISEGAPAWLNREYIENAMREKYGDNTLTVSSIEISPAVSKGANFISALYRVQLEYQTSKHSGVQNMSFIAKMKLQSGGVTPVNVAAEEHDVNSHEMIMYETLLPKLSQLLQKAAFSGRLAPHAIKIDQDTKCLLFEDLCHFKYIMADKKVGLDLIHAKIALKKIAEFHAAGAKLNEIESGSLENFSKNVFKCNAFEPFFRGQLESCGEAVRKWKGYQIYGEKLLELAPRIMAGGRKMFALQEGHFHTLIHSDFWINNIMFKYDAKNRPVECILVDFQFNVWASPAIDITYFINVSLSEDIRWNHEEELVQHYSTCLANTLNKLDYKGKIPSCEEFRSQYLDKGFNEVTSTCIVLPLILAPENVEDSPEAAAIDAKDVPYYQPRVNNALKRLLPKFDKLGLLNYV